MAVKPNDTTTPAEQTSRAPDALKSDDITPHTEGKKEQKPTLEGTLHLRKEARTKAVSMESRNVTALETIADELTTIRVHLTGKA